MPASTDILALLLAAQRGDPAATQELLLSARAELRRIAESLMRREHVGHTLQPTILVHDAFLRLIGYERLDWSSPEQFYANATIVMKQLLTNHARAKMARGRAERGKAQRVVVVDGSGSFADLPGLLSAPPETIDAVNKVMERLRSARPRAHRVVMLRFQLGFTEEQVAEDMGLGRSTVAREWATARAWLTAALSEHRDGGGPT